MRNDGENSRVEKTVEGTKDQGIWTERERPEGDVT